MQPPHTRPYPLRLRAGARCYLPLSGQPSWVDDVRYDIQATVAPEDRATWMKLDTLQQKVVLQRFLTGALHLKSHPDQTLYPYYALVVAKVGPKLQEALASSTLNGPDDRPISRRTMLWTSPTSLLRMPAMQLLADRLAGHTDLPY